MHSLYGKHFLKLADLSTEEVASLVALAAELKAAKKIGSETQQLRGKNVALIFEKTSTRTRCAFEVGAADQGASTTYLGPSGSQIGHKESIKDTARVLGRMYDAIEYRGFGQDIVEELAEYAGVPVYNGLTDEWHPTQMLADLLTMSEHTAKPLQQIAYAYTGDARCNTGNSLLELGCLMGMDVRIAAPKSLQPSAEVIAHCQALAAKSGARVLFTEDLQAAVDGVDFIHTDVWVSMGEPESAWAERIALLKDYQVNSSVMAASGNAQVKFMHCLPAFHDTDTKMGRWVEETFGIVGLEVTDEVFESAASIVFDQAENRMHTIKAVMVATLAK